MKRKTIRAITRLSCFIAAGIIGVSFSLSAMFALLACITLVDVLRYSDGLDAGCEIGEEQMRLLEKNVLGALQQLKNELETVGYVAHFTINGKELDLS